MVRGRNDLKSAQDIYAVLGSLALVGMTLSKMCGDASVSRRGLRAVTVHQFVGEWVCVIDAAEGFEDGARVDGDGSGLAVIVGEVPGEGFDVTVEDDADHLAVAVHGGRAGVAADDVRGVNEIQRRVEIELGLCVMPALRQLEVSAVAVGGGVLIGPAEGSVGRDEVAFVRVTLDGAVAETQSKGSVGISVGVLDGEARLGNAGGVEAEDCVYFVIVLLAQLAGAGI